jgi:hypothetical protein
MRRTVNADQHTGCACQHFTSSALDDSSTTICCNTGLYGTNAQLGKYKCLGLAAKSSGMLTALLINVEYHAKGGNIKFPGEYVSTILVAIMKFV